MFQENERKTALAFILNPSALPPLEPLHTPSHGSSASVLPTMSPLSKADMGTIDSALEEGGCSRKKSVGMYVPTLPICVQKECLRAAVSRGRCVRHGGGSRCTYPNCTHGARLYNRCFHHGGCKLCKITGCTSKAKRFGYCWSHGGGRICDEPSCSKVAAPGGFCWAHGGGNRCKVDGCNRRAYQKHNYYCNQHNGTQKKLLVNSVNF